MICLTQRDLEVIGDPSKILRLGPQKKNVRQNKFALNRPVRAPFCLVSLALDKKKFKKVKLFCLNLNDFFTKFTTQNYHERSFRYRDITFQVYHSRLFENLAVEREFS
jgi:hypothetical protein